MTTNTHVACRCQNTYYTIQNICSQIARRNGSTAYFTFLYHLSILVNGLLLTVTVEGIHGGDGVCLRLRPTFISFFVSKMVENLLLRRIEMLTAVQFISGILFCHV